MKILSMDSSLSSFQKVILGQVSTPYLQLKIYNLDSRNFTFEELQHS